MSGAMQRVARNRCWRFCVRRRNGGDLPILDQYFLNPFEKWSRYGIFPWTFSLHLVLLVLVTRQAVYLFHRDIKHVSRTIRHFQFLFVGDALERDSNRQMEIHSLKTLQAAFTNAVRNHFFINNVSINSYQQDDPGNLRLQFAWRNGSSETVVLNRTEYEAAGGTMDEQSGKDFFQSKVHFLYDQSLIPLVARLRLEDTLLEVGYHGRCFYSYQLSTDFDGTEAGIFKMSQRCLVNDCAGVDNAELETLSKFVFVIASLSIFLVLRKFHRGCKAMQKLRMDRERWNKLSVNDLTSLFSMWWFLAIASNVTQIVTCSACLNNQSVNYRFRCAGVATFLTWLNAVQYFESFPAFNHVFHTIGSSAKRVLHFLFSVLPLFCGFTLLCVCLFWQSAMFATPTASSASLFSLLNGDMVHDAFDEMYFILGFPGHLVLYFFIMLFIFVVLQVNNGIVTDAYEKTKMNPQREHLRALRRASTGVQDYGSVDSPMTSPIVPKCSRSPSPRVPCPKSSAASSYHAPPSPTLAAKYMPPRFFASERIQEALLNSYPERLCSTTSGSRSSAESCAYADASAGRSSNAQRPSDASPPGVSPLLQYAFDPAISRDGIAEGVPKVSQNSLEILPTGSPSFSLVEYSVRDGALAPRDRKESVDDFANLQNAINTFNKTPWPSKCYEGQLLQFWQAFDALSEAMRKISSARTKGSEGKGATSTQDSAIAPSSSTLKAESSDSAEPI